MHAGSPEDRAADLHSLLRDPYVDAVQLGPDLPACSRERWLACVRHGDSARPVPLLVSLLGTPWMPPLDGAILLIEDIHETPQSLDRMVSRSIHSGIPSPVGRRGALRTEVGR